MTVWYKINPNRFTYRELWRLTRGRAWPFAHAVFRKWFNFRYYATSGFAFPDALELVGFQQLPEKPREALGKMVSQAESLGFRLSFCHKLPTLGEHKAYSAVLLSTDGTMLGMAVWVATGGRKASASFSASSRCEGRRLITRNNNPTVDEPPETETLHFPATSVDEIVALHALRLDRRGLERVQRITEEEASPRIAGYRQEVLAFKLARGVYEPMTQQEVDWLSGRMPTPSAAVDGNPYQAPQCLDELRPVSGESQNSEAAPPNPAPPKDSWWGATVGGCVAGIIGGTILMRNQPPHPVFKAVEQWETDFGAVLSVPFLMGVLGGAVSFAAWLRRRGVSEGNRAKKTQDAAGS